MKYYCNPLNVEYAYSFKEEPRDNFKLTVNREAADPSMVMYKGKYYIFASMTGSVWVSDDMANWSVKKLPDNMPIYDYAPDVRVVGDWLYFTASNRGVNCDFYRTKDPLNGPYEKIPGTMEYWDPNLFLDDDGRLYFYWGCDNETPIWGVELDKNTMAPIGEKKDLIFGNPFDNGYERFGENHSENPRTEAEIDKCFADFLKNLGDKAADLPKENYGMIRKTFANMPYIEGAWMTKHDGKYYLQYACPGAEINVYANGVYVGDSPLGPFALASSNPFSYKPGGFIPGAGHGSTMEDKDGMFWHTATMRISKNHIFERRVGIWPAGFDAEGNLFCNQRYGDWPLSVEAAKEDIWKDPDWMLLSYKATATSSGEAAGHPAANATDENVQTWWKANTTEAPWLIIDLGEEVEAHCLQINFADDTENEIACPGAMYKTPDANRYIDTAHHLTRWIIESSLDGLSWDILIDKSKCHTDLPQDFICLKKAVKARFFKLTILEVPYNVNPSISGLRVFGKGYGNKPDKAKADVVRSNSLDMLVSASADGAEGVNILWGNAPDKLYHSWMVMGQCKEFRIGALQKGKAYYVRVDSFNKAGITHGDVTYLEAK